MRKRGFTLIELLIVVAIIATLAGAMMPFFRETRLETQRAKARADLDTIRTACIMLHYDTGDWPPGDRYDGYGLINSAGIPNWNGPYLLEWKRDPWGMYYYVDNYSSNPVRQRARSRGPNRAWGGGDDINLLITPNTSL